MKTGIVSVTFRSLSPFEIIDLTRQAGLDGIEWGTDVHITTPQIAQQVKEAMGELETLSLGSYYRIGQGMDFAPVLKTAAHLNTKNIRVWAGSKNPWECDAVSRAEAVTDARRIADMAAECGIDISFEYHGNTLTASQESAMWLLDEINRENVYLYWQPLYERLQEEYLSEIGEIGRRGKLKNLHVYSWRGSDRYPLEQDEAVWKERLSKAKPYANAALIEFVKYDSPEQFLKDAAILRKMAQK